MKLSKLKLGDKAVITCKIKGHENYKFTGVVEKNTAGELWLTNGKGEGYLVDSKYDYIWNAKLIK